MTKKKPVGHAKKQHAGRDEIVAEMVQIAIRVLDSFKAEAKAKKAAKRREKHKGE